MLFVQTLLMKTTKIKFIFSFHYEKIKELLQGASICLNTSGKSDMLDELASIKNLNNYKSNRNIGTQWKIDLKNFMHSNNIDITQIQSKITDIGFDKKSRDYKKLDE